MFEEAFHDGQRHSLLLGVLVQLLGRRHHLLQVALADNVFAVVGREAFLQHSTAA